MRNFCWHLSIFLPLISCIVVGVICLGKSSKEKDSFSQWFSCICLVISSWASIYGFLKYLGSPNTQWIPLYEFLNMGSLKINVGIQINWISAMMFAVVNTVSALVHIYSVGYMSHDKAIPRFMASLSLFTFMMLMLVGASNFVQLFFGWEGVGLASYLLIGFWHHKESAGAAAMKAFILNRVGDIGLLLGICLAFYGAGTLSIDGFLEGLKSSPKEISVIGASFSYVELSAFFFMIGAMGKSAQIFLHTWLPDAMEGPTPVSALIHAATMVTAGVFLIARISPLFEMAEGVRTLVLIIGSLTSFFAATVAITQNDIKRVIAYSTCSQLGYMFFALGCSAYGAAMFHLFTHAFFKALLFLGAGSVIHAMSDEQDMRYMGGIYKDIPKTYVLMWIGTLALCGMPMLSGYYSKDAILFSSYLSGSYLGQFAYYTGVIVAFMTAFYSTRVMMLTFHGKPRADEKVMAHVHESPLVMILPLVLLAIGSIFSGRIFEGFFSKGLPWINTDNIPLLIHYLPFIAASFGIGLGVFVYKSNEIPNIIKEKLSYLYEISFNKWYFDELYELVFVKPFKCAGNLFQWFDKNIIDKFGPDGSIVFTRRMSNSLSSFQSGSMNLYIVYIAFVIFIILSAFLFFKGRIAL